MSQSWRCCRRRLLELLADEAAYGLNADGREELDRLAAIIPDVDLACTHRVVAAIELGWVGRALELLLESLEKRARASATQWERAFGGG